MTNKTFSIEVELSEQQIENLRKRSPTGDSEAKTVAGVAIQAVRDLADGGMLLDAPLTRQIRTLTGTINSNQDLVKFIEKGVNRKDGCLVGTWFVDPTYEQPLQDIAASQGFTVDQVITNLMDYTISQGNAYRMSPDTVIEFFTKEDFLKLCKILGKEHPTGTDIVAFLEELAGPKPVFAKPYWGVQLAKQ